MSVMFAAKGERERIRTEVIGAGEDAPHALPVVAVKTAARTCDKAETVKTAGAIVAQAQTVNGCVLLKKASEYGARAGFNDKGLYAVCCDTLAKLEKEAAQLSAADVCRLALERSGDVDEAAELVIRLCGEYRIGTGGASFFFADKDGIRRVETAGRLWVSAPVTDLEAVTDYPVTTDDYDFAAPELAGYGKKGGRANFSELFADKRGMVKRGADIRRFVVLNELYVAQNGVPDRGLMPMLMGEKYAKHGDPDGINLASAVKTVRAHYPQDDSRANPCYHGVAEHTAAAFVAEPELGMYGVFAGSLPCVSLALPLCAGGESPLYDESRESAAVDLWYKNEIIMRNLLCGSISIDKYFERQDALEKRLFERARGFSELNYEHASALNAELFEVFCEFIEENAAVCVTDPERIFSLTHLKNSLRYRKVNRELFNKISK